MNNRKTIPGLALMIGLPLLATFLFTATVKGGPQTWQEKVYGIDLQRRGPRRVIVRFAGDVPESRAANIMAGKRVRRRLRVIPAMVADLTASEIKALAAQKEVAFVEPDYRVYALEETLPWGVDRIDAELVHPYVTGKGVRVAILDTGIDYRHPDLDDNYKGGYDAVNMDRDPMDDRYHGTVVAGIIGAEMNDSGVVGVAPEAYLYGVKVLNSHGIGFISNIIAGMEWAIDHKMQIVSMSFGGRTFARNLEDVCRKAYEAGILLIAAAGNSGPPSTRSSSVLFPAAFDTVIAVSATQEDDALPPWSSRGPEVELAAPGVDIYSTDINGGYRHVSGTSSSCPHVTGVAALLYSAYPTLTNVEARTLLQRYALDLGSPGRDELYGYGLVDAYATLSREGEPNQPPTADSGGPYRQVFGAAVSFDASGSYDPDDFVLAYRWEFGDGQSGEGEQITHTYAQEGTYEVTLTVTDPQGLIDREVTTATIVRGEKGSFTVFPEKGYVGYVYSARPDINRFDHSDILVGIWGGNIHYGAFQFKLPSIPESAFILAAQIDLTGRTRAYLGSGGACKLKLLSGDIDSNWQDRSYQDISNAEVLTTIGPTLTERDLESDVVNTFLFHDLSNERIRDGTLSFRLDGPTSGDNNIFCWYSGYSPEDPLVRPALTITYVLPSTGNRPPVADAGADQTAVVSTRVTLDGSGSRDPDGDPLVHQWVQRAGPVVQLSEPDTATPSFTPVETGTYVFELVVSDGLLADSDEVTVEVGRSSGEVEVEYPVISTEDDATATAARNYPFATQFALGTSSRHPYRNFARWALDIPRGSRVVEAALRVKSKETTSGLKAVRINLVDEDSCDDFLSDNPWFRAVSTTTVSWNLAGQWSAGEWYESPDLAALIQEFLERPGYGPGNYLGLRIDEGDPGEIGYRLVESFDGSRGTGGFVLAVIYQAP